MFIETIRSDGLAHLSYLVGSKGEAAVIDPRRDCEVYTELARSRDHRITHIFETHRNEDLLSGAAPLAERSGAAVHHGPHAAGIVAYADTVSEGDTFKIGDLRLDVLETPGHTDDSVSLALVDCTTGDDTVAVFTGDALFVGDVGRTDFYPQRREEVAGLLYDSLRKLEALGDHVVVHPAHGAGSVCGSNMADRDFSTIGYERRNNPRFARHDRAEFIRKKLAEHHEQPPYFRAMERGNLTGADAPSNLRPIPLDVHTFAALDDDTVIVDLRRASSFAGAHIPGSVALPLDMLAAYAGWLLDADAPLALVVDDARQAEESVRRLSRIGYDRITGYLATALSLWAAEGLAFSQMTAVNARTVSDRLGSSENWTLLDVRSGEEFAAQAVPGARNEYLGELPDRLDELDRSAAYTVMCGSGARATIAASLLLRSGFERVDVFLGSMGAWPQADRDDGDKKN